MFNEPGVHWREGDGNDADVLICAFTLDRVEESLPLPRAGVCIVQSVDFDHSQAPIQPLANETDGNKIEQIR